jgi:hypothetical protein
VICASSTRVNARRVPVPVEEIRELQVTGQRRVRDDADLWMNVADMSRTWEVEQRGTTRSWLSARHWAPPPCRCRGPPRPASNTPTVCRRRSERRVSDRAPAATAGPAPR